MRVFIFVSVCFFSFFSLMQAMETIQLHADEMSFDAQTKLLNAKRSVHFTYQGYILKGDKAVFDREKQEVLLTGKVTFEVEGFILRCQKMYLYSEKNILKAFEDVSFDFSVNTDSSQFVKGSCGELTYDFSLKQLLLTKNPLVFQDDHRLRSREIIVDVATGKVMGKGGVRFDVGGAHGN
ncbi:MAG: OstA-like protein [bacterium]